MPIYKCAIKLTNGEQRIYHLKCDNEDQLQQMLFACRCCLVDYVIEKGCHFEPVVDVEIVDKMPEQEWVSVAECDSMKPVTYEEYTKLKE